MITIHSTHPNNVVVTRIGYPPKSQLQHQSVFLVVFPRINYPLFAIYTDTCSLEGSSHSTFSRRVRVYSALREPLPPFPDLFLLIKYARLLHKAYLFKLCFKNINSKQQGYFCMSTNLSYEIALVYSVVLNPFQGTGS